MKITRNSLEVYEGWIGKDLPSINIIDVLVDTQKKFGELWIKGIIMVDFNKIKHGRHTIIRYEYVNNTIRFTKEWNNIK